ncbi:MAG: AdoMet-dependent rRNA methyltransferase spb1 [Watsoniomyces obsoletus]|nr:MAG: AdoMet-dependent rRNA methyltransferase spb1 [Watsoniomyces obsoletus]
MALQKKHGKGRLDKWYKLAREKGYRARAAFKLIQLNKKYNFLEKSKVLLDLCAAPGSWCQVAAETMPPKSIIVGVDLTPIKPIPRVITIQADITTDKCRAAISQHFKTWKADTVLHDGAPNVGTAWVQDAFSQAELTLKSMKLATEFLAEGGTFVTKVFRSKDYNSLLWVFNQLFTKVEATKPPSSRNVSAEIFVVCRGFKAPKRIDPRFLDPRSVFAELAAPTPNHEAKVFKPEIKKRKREGYEEGDYTQFKEAPVSEFIQTKDPIAILGSLNKLSFERVPNGDVAQAAIDQSPETTAEVRQCCADLKVLGRRDFRILLKWRLAIREKFGLGPTKGKEDAEEAEEVTQIEPLDEELRMQEDLQRLTEQESARKKRARRRENERKQKEIIRMQLNMGAPMEIGLEQAGPEGADAIFALKDVDRAGALRQVARGKMGIIVESAKANDEEEEDSDDGSDSEGDNLERELDIMYERYQAYRSETDAKFRARKSRRHDEDGEWHGFSASNASSDDGSLVEDQDDESSASDSDDEPDGSLLKTFDAPSATANGLSKRAELFFDQDIFKGVPGLEEDDSQEMDVDRIEEAPEKAKSRRANGNGNITTSKTRAGQTFDEEEEDANSFEVVVNSKNEDENWEERQEPRKNGRLDIDIITAEAMTLAQKLASGEVTKQSLMDDGFNKFTFRDTDGLPEWFLDDEAKHSKPLRPITAAAAAAIKEKLRAMNARPIKKVREAKDRKRFKAAQRLEKLRKKSAMLAEDSDMTEKDKAQTIAKMMNKAVKRKPKQQVKLVVARGGNRGISGRPRGVKGKYKIVDARLKKDVRAEKRLAKKRK